MRIWSPSLTSDTDKQKTWTDLCADCTISASADDAIAGADVVMLCTSSGTPVIDHTQLSATALVTSISTNVARAHEIDPGFLSGAQVYCDYRATAPLSAGEMVLAAEKHGWSSEDIVGDLPELMNSTCALPDGKRPVFFRSIGLGLEDLAMAEAIHRVTQNAE